MSTNTRFVKEGPQFKGFTGQPKQSLCEKQDLNPHHKGRPLPDCKRLRLLGHPDSRFGVEDLVSP